MKERADNILPGLSRILSGLGTRLKVARLRRRFRLRWSRSAQASREPRCTESSWVILEFRWATYARVMQVLRLEEDLKRLAVDDELGA